MTEQAKTDPTTLTRAPRETSGARSANRFTFQKSWTLCHLLDLHKAGTPYVVVCEYHDDVAVLDAVQPSRVAFYQVKTSSTRWTLNRLIARAKGKTETNGSILGKMYGHRKDHGALVESTNFVSNACFNIPLASGDTCSERLRVGVHELAAEERTRAATAVQGEHALPTPADFGETTWLTVTDLAPNGHETYARGKLSEFLGEQKRDFNVTATYRVLFGEVVRRTDREGTFASITDAVTAKGITRAQVEALLTAASSLPEIYRSGWTSAESRLNHEAVPFGQIQQLRHAYTRYFAERMDESNDALQSLRNAIRARVASLLPVSSTLGELLNIVATEFGSDAFPLTYVQAMAIMEMAHDSSAVQKAGSKPTEPTP